MGIDLVYVDHDFSSLDLGGSEYEYLRSLVMDSTASTAELHIWSSDATIISFRSSDVDPKTT